MVPTMDRASSSSLSPKHLKFLFHHIFLPPKLPQKDDFSFETQLVMIDATLVALQSFKTYAAPGHQDVVGSVVAAVDNLKKIHQYYGDAGGINEESLLHAMRELCDKGGTIPLYVRAQNAAVHFSKAGDSVHVEVFELSPKNEAIVSTKGRLRRSFPGPAFSIDISVFENPELQATIAHTLARMSHPAVDTKPKAKKSGQSLDEERDSTHPKLVTELFLGFLGAIGKPVDVLRLWKNTREEVFWLSGLLPWRRSAMWLLMRVTTQLLFSRGIASPEKSQSLYKSFMVFLMSRVLELSGQQELSSEVLYAMNAKVARRLFKLDSAMDRPELCYVRNIVQDTESLILSRWMSIVQEYEPPLDLTLLDSLDIRKDTVNILPQLDAYISSIGERERRHQSNVVFRPPFALTKQRPDELPSLPDSPDQGCLPYELRSLEFWVNSHLVNWLNSHKSLQSTCGELGQLIQSYYGVAHDFYYHDPEATSTMLLTILEIWTACDESATSIYTFLEDYDPGIPEALLQSLVLPSKSQMERLLRVENYLSRRRKRAILQPSSLFTEYGRPNCFSVRYFGGSLEHQNLLGRIEARAKQERQAKRDEISLKRAERKVLLQKHDDALCEYRKVVVDHIDGPRKPQHSKQCQKCWYKRQAESLSAEIHEWPLPTDVSEKKSTVFELKVPHSYGRWRDTTIFVLMDVMKTTYVKKDWPKYHYHLHEYNALRSDFDPCGKDSRIGLLSNAKPHIVTHRSQKMISSTKDDDFLLNNGMKFRYYDKTVHQFVQNLDVTDDLPDCCTYQLPPTSSSLQPYLFRSHLQTSGPPPNTVIAGQNNCPGHMSSHEYKSLSTIPLGYRIQWQNILMEISMPSINLKNLESAMTILQCIHQAGPPGSSSVLRAGHSVVGDEKFADVLLRSLGEALGRVEKNWESFRTLGILISLATRLLSLTPVKHIASKALVFLARGRAATFEWTNILQEKARNAVSEDQRTELTSKSVEIALICVDSFSIDDEYLRDTLGLHEDASVLIQCFIIIQEGRIYLAHSFDPMTRIMRGRRDSLADRTYPILARGILMTENSSLDDAVLKRWRGYRAGDGWHVAEEAGHWLVTQTADKVDEKGLRVHFDLLTGELLVNGLPLARLPRKYEEDEMYRVLFGKMMLKVMPSDRPGMQFCGKSEYQGYTLEFGMNESTDLSGTQFSDLLVQATRDGRTRELVPRRVLCEAFPITFIDQYVHWYDKDDDYLEFLPAKDPWISSSASWRLKRNATTLAWYLTQGENSLVHIRTESARVLSGIFSPLEDRPWIHLIFNSSSSSLTIELPRTQLEFGLGFGKRSIESKDFRGMIIDADQSLGTLVGLQNKLLLKHEGSGNRLVLLLKGDVRYVKQDDHISVTVEKSSVGSAYGYYIDYKIGRLVDNGSLQSKLFLSYVHALTSFCLPDPLTRMTGTEQALSKLNSAAVRSFERLQTEDGDILAKIAKLTPGRNCYPLRERSMQTVTWSRSLGFLVQHGGFYKCVRSLFDQASHVKLFSPDLSFLPPELHPVDRELLERDSIRSSAFRVSGFGAEDHTAEHDVAYLARDCKQNSPEGFKAFLFANIIHQKPDSLPYSIPIDFKASLWRFLSYYPLRWNSSSSVLVSEVKFDSEWLLNSAKFLAEHWGGLHEMLSLGRSTICNFRTMIWFSTLAFAKDSDTDILQALASFLTLAEMAQITPPAIKSFTGCDGAKVDETRLRDELQKTLLPLDRCLEAELLPDDDEHPYDFQLRQEHHFQTHQEGALGKLIGALKSQWPCATPICGNSTAFDMYLDVEEAVQLAKPLFESWFNNYRIDAYLGQIVQGLRCRVETPIQALPLLILPTQSVQRIRGYIDNDDILAFPAPQLPPRITSTKCLLSTTSPPRKSTDRLTALVKRLEAQACLKYQKKYVESLRGSLRYLEVSDEEHCSQVMEKDPATILFSHRSDCRAHVDRIYEALVKAATDKRHVSSAAAAAASSQQWPRLSPAFFLYQLTRRRWLKLTDGWKQCIVDYALALTELGRAERLVKACGNNADLVRELQNSGHTTWCPMDYPESLLLEVESGILIRENQERVAQKMRHSENGENTVMQLNMGEGKSSVIIPIVASALADGSQLVRVFVAKPQAKQMLQMLVTKLGGLLDRQIYHMPFSRAKQLGIEEAMAIDKMCVECMTNGGILLVQPEHVLSFKLMGLESLISGKEKLGTSLLSIQKSLTATSRDIVDESDEIFSVKFELIYTMGQQRPIEFSPRRWFLIQEVLSLVRSHACEVKKRFPLGIELYETCSGGFPRIRIVRPKAQQYICRLIARHICDTGLTGFPIARQSKGTRDAVFDYIVKPDLSAEEIAKVERGDSTGIWRDTSRDILLLLRGLIAGGVLAFALGQKRWRVNYGLDIVQAPRTRLAVPYRAKDQPTHRSEFSHPDVVILLTCLSYYYEGLANDDLFLALGRLVRSDQATVEYQAWVKDAQSLPSAFEQYVGINLTDEFQCIKEVFPAFQHAKSAIDYFLAHIVFPKYAKEFPQKLSASGWDIGQIKPHPTTGFSGTNDSRVTLPSDMKYLDVQEQGHTNALVLDYLLQPENSVEMIPPQQKGTQSNAERLLDTVSRMEPPTRVILDVGAQILELGNLDVARRWLEMKEDDVGTQAVVFFDEHDELSVIDRRGQVELLQTSFYADQLDKCLIFLDEAHTRGIDLKLPTHYRAAVTLGANLTKDRLVQACMRMRKLGQGQSVIFCVPEEIKNKILRHEPEAEAASIDGPEAEGTRIDVSDVLSWSISETWTDMRQSVPLWATQGERFESQAALHDEYGIEMSKEQAEAFLEDDCQSLSKRYRPRSPGQVRRSQGPNNIRIAAVCREFDQIDFKSAGLGEEQERELCPEAEQERQNERPAPAEAAKHRIHSHVERFVETGCLVEGSVAYQPAFESLRNTSAAEHLDVSQFPHELLVTSDFANTIQNTSRYYISDLYQRSVQWVLAHVSDSAATMKMMIISPYEAQKLLPMIQTSQGTTLHLYGPRLNLDFAPLDGLDLYRTPRRPGAVLDIPRTLVVQLNLFAGQLYVGSFEEYTELCDFLGLAWKETEKGDGVVVAADGFIIEDLHGRLRSPSTFRDSPVKFLSVLMSQIRRGGEAIDKTHLGKILDGRLLRPSDFGEGSR